MNIKKITTLALAAVLGVSALTGCGTKKADEPKKDTSLAKVQEQGYFTLGLDADFAPMGFTQEM